MDERLRVADLQAGNPPVFHVGMIAVGDVNRFPAANFAFVFVIETLAGDAGRADPRRANRFRR